MANPSLDWSTHIFIFISYINNNFPLKNSRCVSSFFFEIGLVYTGKIERILVKNILKICSESFSDSHGYTSINNQARDMVAPTLVSLNDNR
jgi:hypothetical protein